MFDDDGRRVGEVITEDSPFDPAGVQLELLMALELAEEDICPGCGGWLSVTTVPDHGHELEDSYCFRCMAIEAHHEKLNKDAEVLKGTSEYLAPSARRVTVREIPLPGDELTEDNEG